VVVTDRGRQHRGRSESTSQLRPWARTGNDRCYFLGLWHLEHRLAEALGHGSAKELSHLVGLAVEGIVDALIARLRDLWAAANQADERARAAGQTIGYVDSNQEGIANYARHGGAIERLWT